jgi:hypothetical protein
MQIAAALGNVNAAIVIQQLHYWMEKKEVGVVVDGIKYIYNTYRDWVKTQFSWLSQWQLRQAMSLLRSLEIVKVIRYKAKEWNQTNYYTLDGERLNEYLKSQSAGSIEMSELQSNTPQGERSCTLEMRNSELSLYETKITTGDLTTKQVSDRHNSKSQPFAAAQPKTTSKEEKISKRVKSPEERLTASARQNKVKSEQIEEDTGSDKTPAGVDYIVNKDWQKQIEELDSTGILINKTVINLLKMYSPEQVRGAIALFRSRKKEQYIPNPSGYFVAALKGDWGSKTVIENESTGDRDLQIDTAAVFRHWYDLARELGYCGGQEVREGEQWVVLSGSWEKWEDAVKRGYSLEYLKKIMKRNLRQ